MNVEAELAIKLAREILRRSGDDPSSDVAILARQFLRAREILIETREAAYNYARVVHVELYLPHSEVASTAYDSLRATLGNPIGLATKPHLVKTRG